MVYSPPHLPTLIWLSLYTFSTSITHFSNGPVMPSMQWQVGWTCFTHGEGSFSSTRRYVVSIKSWYKVHFQQQGQPIQDVFHWGLGYVIQWYDILQVHIEWWVESALQVLDTRICKYQKGQSMNPTPPQPTMQTAMGDLTRGECARLLQQRCPACFAGTLYGWSFIQ
jgi:hypothetical protein